MRQRLSFVLAGFLTLVATQSVAEGLAWQVMPGESSYRLQLVSPIVKDGVVLAEGVSCTIEQYRGHNTEVLYQLRVIDSVNQWRTDDGEGVHVLWNAFWLYPDPEQGHTVREPNEVVSTISDDAQVLDWLGVHDPLDECMLVTEGLPEHLIEVLQHSSAPEVYWSERGGRYHLVGGREGLDCEIVTGEPRALHGSTYVVLRAFDRADEARADVWYVPVRHILDHDPSYVGQTVQIIEDSGFSLAEECLRTTRAGLVLDRYVMPALYISQ